MKLRHLNLSRLAIKIASTLKRHIWAIVIAVVLFGLSILGVKGYKFLASHNVKPTDLLGFFGTPVQNLDSTDGVTNFLLLGIRGEGQDSPNLSDTIMVFSYNHDTKKGIMLSVPRDLWVPSIKAKINTAYFYGEEASSGAGIKMAQAAILEDLGLPIHYTAVVNFSLFIQTVNLVGGVDINVSPGFTDNEFPIPGKENALPISSRYETITFPEGMNHLDGITALKFVRSRHSVGEEGTDFARSRRQQQVIDDLRQKMINPSFLLDKEKVSQFMNIISNNLKTNIPENLYPTLAKLALDTKNNTIKTFSLSNLPDDQGITILYNPPLNQYSGEWVLIPKGNNWNTLKQYVHNHLQPAEQQ